MPDTRPTRLPPWSSVHLNAIRGAAALVVLLGHTRGLFFKSFTDTAEPSHTTSYPHGAPQPTVGEAAVIVFFVLSGYLVGGSVLRSIKSSRWSWKDYLFKRITRLWVVLLPALAFGVSLDLIGMHFAGMHTSIYAAPASTLVPRDLVVRLGWKAIVANALFLQGVLSPTAGTNNSLWSLAYEWWYYLMFPLAILAFLPSTRPLLRIVYMIMLAAAAIAVGRNMMALFPAWLLGAAVAAMPAMVFPRAVMIPLLAVATSCILLIKKLDLSYYSAALCVALAFTLVLWSAVHHRGACRSNRYRRVSGFFSDISYTLYLTHLPLAIFMCALVNRPWHYHSLSPMNVLLFLLMNSAIVGFAYLFYRLFEGNTEPIRAFLAKDRTPQRGTNMSSAPSESHGAANLGDSKLAVTAYD